MNFKNVNSREKKQREMQKGKKVDTKVTSDDDDDAKAFVEEHLSTEKVNELRKLARKISRSVFPGILCLGYQQFPILYLLHSIIVSFTI